MFKECFESTVLEEEKKKLIEVTLFKESLKITNRANVLQISLKILSFRRKKVSI